MAFLSEPVALAADVQHVAVVQHGRGDDAVAQVSTVTTVMANWMTPH